MESKLRKLAEQFKTNPYSWLPPEHKRIIRTQTFRKTLIDPSHKKAIEFPEYESFERLIGLGDISYRDAQDLNPELLTHAPAYFKMQEHLIEKNEGLAHNMTNLFLTKTADIDDLLSDAFFALMRSVNRFNPWRGFRFSTYACNAIARTLARNRKKSIKYRKRFPCNSIQKFERPIFKESIHDDESLLIERITPISDNLHQFLEPLEEKIISARFLLDSGTKRLTFRELGEAEGFSKERIRQIQNTALEKIREVLDRDGEYSPTQTNLPTTVTTFP